MMPGVAPSAVLVRAQSRRGAARKASGTRRAAAAGARRATTPRSLATATLEACAIAVAVVVPLFFNPRTERVFEPDKLAWVIVLAVMALAALLALAVARPAGARQALRRPLVRALLLLAVAIALGTGLSLAPSISVGGAYRRGHGAIAWTAWLVLAAAAAAASRWSAPRQRLRAALVAPAVPAALYALLQRLRIDTIPWQQYGDDATIRAFGPLGNAIFLGAYLAVVAPLAAEGMLRAWRAGDRGRASAHATIVVLCAAGVLASQSRGPALGLLAGLGTVALLTAVRAGRRRLTLAVLGAAVGVPLLLIGLGRAGVPGLDRFGDLLSPSSRTVRQRALAWEGLATAALADPARILIGYGPETTALVLAPNAPAELRALVPDQVFDRAHNVLWEWWVSAGLLGVLALVSVYVAAFGTAYRALGWLATRTHAAALGATALGGAVIGAVLVGLVAAPLAAAGATLGLAAGLVGWGLWRGLRSTTTPEPASGMVLAVLGVLAAHLVEGALGLPTAAAELVFWLALGLLLGATNVHDKDDVEPARDAVADGLAIGLGLATLAFAPLFLPFGITAVFEGPKALLILLPAAFWVLLAAVLPNTANPWRRDAAAVVVVAGFALTFQVLQGAVGGPTFAFAAVLLAVVVGMAVRRAGPVADARPPSLWLAFAGVLAMALAVGGWLGLRPVLADAWLRFGLERATLGERTPMSDAFDHAVELWPAQPVLALYVAAARRDEMVAPSATEAERAAALAAGVAALEGAWRRVPAPEYARQLATLYRERGDLAADPAARAAAWAASATWFERALEADPHATATFAAQAALLERLGDSGAAADGYRAALGSARSDPALLAALARAELGGDDPEAVGRAAEALAEAWTIVRQGGNGDVDAFVALLTTEGALADGPLGDPLPRRAMARARVLALGVAGRPADAREALTPLQGGPGAGAVEAALGAWLAAHTGSG